MESDRLRNEISSRNELLSRIDTETETVEEVSPVVYLFLMINLFYKQALLWILHFCLGI